MASQLFALKNCALMIQKIKFHFVAACLLLTFGLSAHGALIVDSLQYDGHVRINSTTGVEEHHLETNFPPPTSQIPLPATNGPLSAPLASANDLRITSVDLALMAVLNGEILPRMTIWIQNPSSLDNFEVFDNPLDTNLAYPVRLNLSLFLEELGPNQQLVVQHQVESLDGAFDFAIPFPAVAPPSGRGSQADPLLLQLGLPASSVSGGLNNGPIKALLYYKTEEIPEPAAWMIALVGIAMTSMAGRRG